MTKKIMALTIVLVFVTSLAAVAVAEETYSLKGGIVSVDPTAKTLTVKAVNTTISSPTRFKGEVTLVTDDMTKITMGKKKEGFDGLKVGEKVKVMFYEKDGKDIANHIIVLGHPEKSS